MKLDFIPLDKLSVSKANMRYARKAPDVSDILPTVRKRGVIQPVIVRANPCPEPVEGCAPDAFEIIAGSRRFHAALIVAAERRAAGEDVGETALLPCAILDEGDDADAVEASLIENMARLDPLGHVSRVSFDRKDKRVVCLFQAARSAYPKSWRRAAWNKHLRGGCGIVPLAIGGDESVTRTPLGLSARLSAPHI